jgi:hypothetical protein
MLQEFQLLLGVAERLFADAGPLADALLFSKGIMEKFRRGLPRLGAARRSSARITAAAKG